MLPAPPKIDSRTAEDIIKDLRSQRANAATPHDQGELSKIAPLNDLGDALIGIFARMAAGVIARMNTIPERNHLAFLDMIGATIHPPHSARAPLTFALSDQRAPSAVVPAHTQVATSPGDGLPEAVFETEQNLLVTAAQVVAAWVRDPHSGGRYADYSAIVHGEQDGTFPAFIGTQAIDSYLYLACDTIFGLPSGKTITVSVSSNDTSLQNMAWSTWNGMAWLPVQHAMQGPSAALLSDPLVCVPQTLNGFTARWMRARLEKTTRTLSTLQIAVASGLASETPLNSTNRVLAPEAVYVNTSEKAAGTAFQPFGASSEVGSAFYIKSEVFGQKGARVQIQIVLAGDGVVPEGTSVVWEYYKENDWAALPQPAFGQMGKIGTIAFTVPDTIVRRKVPNTSSNEGYWIRARLTGGSFGTTQIANLWLSVVPTKPVATGALLPEQALVNTAPIDATTTFRPFGERPRVGDLLYLKHDAVFALKGAQVTLVISIANGAVASSELTLAWEYWNGTKWDNLDAADATAQLTKTENVVFTVPADVAPTTVSGVLGSWVRVRLVSGNYGTEPYFDVVKNGAALLKYDASYRLIEHSDGQPLKDGEKYHYVPVNSGFTPPLITSLTIGYALLPHLPDMCLVEHDFALNDITSALQKGTPLTLFPATTETDPALYLGLDQPLPNRPVQVYVQVAPAPFDESMAETVPASVVWEYAAAPAGGGAPQWKPLNAQDQTRSLAERGMVSFIGPPDHQRRTEFGRDLYWLRAQRVAGASVPRIGRVLTNTVWASHATTVFDQELGSSDGSAGQRFYTSAAPVLAGQQISVREPLPPPNEQAALRVLEGIDAIEADANGAELAWVRWHAVPDFYASGPRDRHYVFDCLKGEIRFGDGQHGLIPPQGRGNIRALLYRTGGGTLGNRAANSIIQLKTALAYIASATNSEAASGGADSEPLERIKEHGAHILRHNGRAVAAQDYEDLALEASSAVARALVVTQRINPLDLEGHFWVDDIATADFHTLSSEVKAGFVDLVIVPLSDALPPVPSLELIRQIRAYLQDRSQPNVTLRVFGPNWVKVDVTATIVPAAFDTPALSVAIADALQGFLHPLTGGPQGQGWPFGAQVHESDLYAFLETLPGVEYVTDVTITPSDQVFHTTFDKDQRKLARTLIYPGSQTIILVSTDQGA